MVPAKGAGRVAPLLPVHLLVPLHPGQDEEHLYSIDRLAELPAIKRRVAAQFRPKPCLARTDTVIEYLGRYSHRIALSDSRLLDFDEGDDTVDVRYKDYRDGSRNKVMTLSGEELIRRFLLHVLPKGFMRVRHFGFLANRCRARCLALIRTALAAPPPAPAAEPAPAAPFDGYPCPKCRTGRLHVTALLAPLRRGQGVTLMPATC